MPRLAMTAAVTGNATTAAEAQGFYAAIVARDARFDGRLFVGVTSTRIYCRPVCRVRTPLQRNCRFFGHAAAAEAAGFRPCLRCRPELAPGLSLIDSPLALAQHAARAFDQAAADGRELPLPDAAARLGVSDRHLRRIFQHAWGVSPGDYLRTRRLLLAKQLLSDTPMPVTQVAHASGFGSLRRFNAAFAEHYGLSPSGLRKQCRTTEEDADGALTVRLGYRPPYDVEGVLRFFRDRAVPGVERVEGLEIRRTLAWPGADGPIAGWLLARFVPDRSEVHVRVAPSLMPVLGAVLQRQRQALDLDADPALIAPALMAMPLAPRAGLRVPNGVDGFEIAARVILGQQVTVAAARTLTRRLVEAFGEPVVTPFADLTRLFPSAATLAEADPEKIGKLGIVRQRVRALQSLAAAVCGGEIELHRGAPLHATMDALRALPGVGEWTVQLIAMRALAWPDAFPATDMGVLNALGTRDVKSVEAMAQAWRPWRAYAVMCLWQTLETGT